MIEWQLGKAQRSTGTTELQPELRTGGVEASKVRVRSQIGHDDDALDTRQFADACDERERIKSLASVEVAIGANQDFRFDLREAVEHRLCSKIGRTRRPDCTAARSRERGNDGLRNVFE